MAHIVAGLLLSLASAPGASSEPETYAVAVSVEVGGETLGTPSMELRPGLPLTFGIAGSPRYRLNASLDAVEDRRAMLSFALAFPEGDEWKIVARPSVLVAIGEEGSMEIAGDPSRGRRAIRLRYRVTPD